MTLHGAPIGWISTEISYKGYAIGWQFFRHQAGIHWTMERTKSHNHTRDFTKTTMIVIILKAGYNLYYFLIVISNASKYLDYSCLGGLMS